jgi:hypothetical protein
MQRTGANTGVAREFKDVFEFGRRSRFSTSIIISVFSSGNGFIGVSIRRGI